MPPDAPPHAPAPLPGEADDTWRALSARLTVIPGVVGVVLGGSRARGDALPSSDVDLGLYVDESLDLRRLEDLARDVAGPDAVVGARGGWGPWVDGGAWLSVDGVAVDWIYRDVGRVRQAVSDAVDGRAAWHVQPGHPLGFLDVAYAGELASGGVLADPSGVLGALRSALDPFPAALAETLADGTWEASFLVEGALKGARRGDSAYVAGCLFRAFGVCAHALLGRAGQWATNDKGLVARAGSAATAPDGWAAEVHTLLARPGSTPDDLAATLTRARALVDAAREAVGRG
ncbi:nucleotidyltransferase domain-containing protein [Luteimicrobium subarcticum]|uniref:Nucleotidyltransferase-like protein n=1 Tax=Luteimicrobium subarcticum TaxID=620910 RepID=A0A2M8WVB5_9MICO|nr:nucleotidyltransferase domain-containing protein [Luteimicrobium subarcticum]PJI94871.1 nucleotidyltransferase-like protein [Luteimicrobium subarcticum]